MAEIKITESSTPQFQKKIWTATGIIAFVVISLLIIKSTFSVFLLLFAGILLAVFLQGVAGLARKYLKSSDK